MVGAKIENISSLSRATGLHRTKILTLIEHYGIPVDRRGNLALIEPGALPRLVEILKRHPGVNESFVAVN